MSDRGVGNKFIWQQRRMIIRDLIAEKLHDEYEKQAKIVGWKTQDSCQVRFRDLPEKNKEVMFRIAELVMEIKDKPYYMLGVEKERAGGKK